MLKRRPYRTLFAVYAVTILAGICEFTGGTSKQAEPDIYAGSDHNYPEAMARLYPGSPDAEYAIGRRFEALAGRGFDPGKLQRNAESLQEFVDSMDVNLRQAAQHYERAISMGLKSDEGLYYNYALTLIRIQSDPVRIDRAIADWRREFPFSERRDLEQRRKSIELQLRNLPPASGSRSRGQMDARSLGHKSTHSELRRSNDDVDSINSANIEPGWQSVPGYVGSEACRQCHPKPFETFRETAHSRAMSDVHPDDEPPDAQWKHALSGHLFRVTRRDGKLVHEEGLPLDDGSEFVLTSAPVKYRVGSGHFARTYLCDAGGGFLVESPISWYESTHGWGMTPGFDKPAHRSFSRQIVQNCLWCHTGHTEMSATSNFRFRIIEKSIGCERCHGPGEAHIKSQIAQRTSNAKTDDAIVNPARLTRKLAEAICQQCHLQGDIHIGASNVRAVDYRPGLALEEFETVYRLRSNDTAMTVVGHVEQLGESACYRQSKTLTCTTCHDPHVTIAAGDRVKHYQSVCLKCHTDPGCKLDISVRDEKSGNDCIRCHMPKSPTEVSHVAFTHHRIGIHPLKNKDVEHSNADRLIPLSDLSGLSKSERNRSLMLARLQMFLTRGTEFQRSVDGRLLVEQIDQWLGALDAPDVEIEFARSQFLFARGDVSGAAQSAIRALAFRTIRSEEKAVLLQQLGDLDFRQNRFEEARPRYRELVEVRCQGQDWFHLAICEERCGHPDAAIIALERARRLEPASVGIYETLAKMYLGRGNIEAAKTVREDGARLKRFTLPIFTPP